MDPVTLSIAAQGAQLGLGLLFDAIGEAEARGDRQRAEALREQARQRLASIKDPETQALVAEQLGPSQMGAIKTDPALRGAQLQALRKLQEEGEQGGMTAEDRQALEETRQEAQRDEQAQRQAIMAGARARGMGSSQANLSAQLVAQQAGADRQHRGNLQVAADARRRALQSLAESGQLAGQVRGQDFGEEAQKARAQDEISRWNATTRYDAQKGNNALAQDRAGFQLQKANLQATEDRRSAMDAEAEAERKRNRRLRQGAGISDTLGGAANTYNRK